jgi:hypothetical protein
MSEACRKCANPVLLGKKLCAYHKAERDAKVIRAFSKAGKFAKEAGTACVEHTDSHPYQRQGKVQTEAVWLRMSRVHRRKHMLNGEPPAPLDPM